MSMIKVITPGSYQFDAPATQLIKLSSRGLVGDDLRGFIKRAGHHMADVVKHLQLGKDEVPIHMLAIGATSAFGPNRNGDGFEEDVCRAYHPTFVKHARFYRDHKNKDKSKSYGLIKASMYVDPMKRIELIAALNGSREAALRNGGLLADRELEKLARDEDIAVSMACRVPFDICSGCGNRATKKEDYCRGTDEGGLCKYGGLKNNIGMLLEDGHILHARNTIPAFFDLSHVFRPADRIAYVTGILEKAASAGRTVSGVELADAMGVTIPCELRLAGDARSDVARQVKLAYQLADLEEQIQSDTENQHWAPSFAAAVYHPVELEKVAEARFDHVLRSLTDARIVLSLSDFIQLTTNDSLEKSATTAEIVGACLPGVYGRLINDQQLENIVQNNPYNPAPACRLALQTWAQKQAADCSLRSGHADRRRLLASLRQVGDVLSPPAVSLVKLASQVPAAAKLAVQYGLYKLAFLSALPENDPEMALTLRLGLLQNYVH